MLIIYEKLEEFMKGRSNTQRWKDGDEKENYIRTRWRETSNDANLGINLTQFDSKE